MLDRAGITGPDGASHNGVWDVSIAGLVPGLMLASPRDRARLRDAMRLAITVDDAPTLIRYSKEKLPHPLPAVSSRDGLDMLSMDPDEIGRIEARIKERADAFAGMVGSYGAANSGDAATTTEVDGIKATLKTYLDESAKLIQFSAIAA